MLEMTNHVQQRQCCIVLLPNRESEGRFPRAASAKIRGKKNVLENDFRRFPTVDARPHRKHGLPRKLSSLQQGVCGGPGGTVRSHRMPRHKKPLLYVQWNARVGETACLPQKMG